MKHLTIKFFLYGITPEIWRRVMVPAELSFASLHVVLQQAMGWKNLYAHEFRHGKGKNLLDVIGPATMKSKVPVERFQDEATLTLQQFVGRSSLPKRLLYVYDEADEWIHELVIEATSLQDEPVLCLLEGARACPPEACGGVEEYLDICAGESAWFDEPWDAEAFELSAHSLQLP